MPLEGKTKMQLFLTRIMSWRPILIIFLLLFLPGLIFKSEIAFPHIDDIFFFTILYHLLISLPSSILANIENKILKFFLHLASLFIVFILLMTFIVEPIYSQAKENAIKHDNREKETIETRVNITNIK